MSGDDVSLRGADLVREAERPRHLPEMWSAPDATCAAETGAPVKEPSRMTYRTPGSTRDTSYWRQVWDTVLGSLLFVGAGVLFCWLWNR